MKTILVPTDFSRCADNAIDYAIEIAKLTKAKLILFNVYQSQVIPAEAPILLPIEETAADAMEALKKEAKRIRKQCGEQISLDYSSAWGFPVEQIDDYARKHKIDLIVMGMQGAGFLEEKVIGSVTTSLIRKSKCPVLAIDSHVKFKSIKKIALACDYSETKNNQVFAPLKEFAQLFKSHVYVLNVVPETEKSPAIAKAVAGIKMDRILEDIDHSFHFSTGKNVVDGINHFADANNIDMIVMIPHPHTSLKTLFAESNTKRMAFHTKIPLLSLHE